MAADQPSTPSNRRGLVRRRNALRGMSLAGLLGLIGGTAGGFSAGRRWPPGPQWVTQDFDFDLDLTSPYVSGYSGPYSPTKPVDDDGIVITLYKGERVYHPVDACWYLFPQLHSYEMDSSSDRLDSVLATTDHLLEGAETHRIPSEPDDDPQSAEASLWFPYHFEHTPGDLANGVPWYSGMAQGMMLSHLVRLFEVTGNEEWRLLADQVYNSFRHYRDGAAANSMPWFVSYSDDGHRRFTYFEEYPSTDPAQLSHVVNGNVYAMWGVYDYLRISEDRHARTILSRALATLLESFAEYRASGNPSLYGTTPWSHLTWGNPENYHRGVVSMLRRTAALAQEPTFTVQADILQKDIDEHAEQDDANQDPG